MNNSDGVRLEIAHGAGGASAEPASCNGGGSQGRGIRKSSYEDELSSHGPDCTPGTTAIFMSQSLQVVSGTMSWYTC